VLGRPLDLLDGALGIVYHRHARHSRAPVGTLAAHLGQPSVVGARTGHHLLGVARSRAAEPGAERRRVDLADTEHVGVGKDHLGRDAVVVEERVALVRVGHRLQTRVTRLREEAVDELVAPALVASQQAARARDVREVLLVGLAEVGLDVLAVMARLGTGVAVR
jgi:hypothetical protein